MTVSIDIKHLIRVLLTAIVVVIAILGSRWLWIHYNVEPWTRDGRVRADVVQVTPDVSGLVAQVAVKNDQLVTAGQILFILDRPRFELAERQAEALVLADQSALDQAIREQQRNRALDSLVTAEHVEEATSKVEELRAQVSGALVQRDLARLNFERTTIRATVNGIVTNVDLQPGDFATAGRPVMALVATDSIHVDGYFEETKLPRIQLGDPATVRIMGLPTELYGTVESIAGAIADRERSGGSTDIANVNPTFSWVRLAQRIPVRIHLESVPRSIRLIAGRTATVSIQTPAHRPLEGVRE